jgi:hypothetical protein
MCVQPSVVGVRFVRVDPKSDISWINPRNKAAYLSAPEKYNCHNVYDGAHKTLVMRKYLVFLFVRTIFVLHWKSPCLVVFLIRHLGSLPSRHFLKHQHDLNRFWTYKFG